MLYCSDSPPDHWFQMPLLNRRIAGIRIGADDLQLLVGDLVAERRR